MVLDFNDLGTIKAAATAFLDKETRLDVLFNNAAVMHATGTTKQGHEAHMGINCLGPHLFTTLLEPILVHTAASAPAGSVRIVNTSSLITAGAPAGGMVWDEAAGRPAVLKSSMETYMISKIGNVYLARDASRRLGGQGVLAVSLHPGLMRTGLQKNMPKIVGIMMVRSPPLVDPSPWLTVSRA